MLRHSIYLTSLFSAVFAIFIAESASAIDVQATVTALRLKNTITGGQMPVSDPMFASMVAKVQAGDVFGAADIAARCCAFHTCPMRAAAAACRAARGGFVFVFLLFRVVLFFRLRRNAGFHPNGDTSGGVFVGAAKHCVGWAAVPPAARVESEPHAQASRSARSSDQPCM
jgi:hypothetical protein